MNRYYLFLIAAIVFNSVANVLMKTGMKTATADAGIGGMIKHYLSSWPVMVGLVLFGLNLVAYTQALTKINLSVAYPIMVSSSLFIVAGASIIQFKESISWIQWVGFVLIIAGSVCVTRVMEA